MTAGRDRRGRPRTTVPPVPRKPRRPAALDTYEVVVTAAERVLEQDGIDGLTTNHVAEVAGVSIGSLYQYFPNKHAIVAALFERFLAEFDAIFAAAVEPSATVEDAALALATAVAARYARQPRIFRQLWQLRTAADAHQRIAASHARMIAAVRELLVRAEVATAERAALLAFMLVHAGDGIANGVANAGGAVDPQHVAHAFVAVVRAIVGGAPELLGGSRAEAE